MNRAEKQAEKNVHIERTKYERLDKELQELKPKWWAQYVKLAQAEGRLKALRKAST